MPTAFTSTLRSLDARHRPAYFLGLAGVLALLAAWSIWFVRAPLALHAVSTEARLEAAAREHAVASLLAGRLQAVEVELGATVDAGDPLFQLDDTQTRRLREAQTAKRDGARDTLDALTRQVANETRRLGEVRQRTRSGIEEDRERERQAQAQARLDEAENARLQRLAAEGVVAEAEAERAALEAERSRATAGASGRAADRRRADNRAAESALSARLDELGGEMALEQTRLAEAEAEIARLDDLLEQHRIVAPVAGRVGFLADVRPGAVVGAGIRLATVVPREAYRVIADFEPSAAVGRIRPGQSATVRFEGFPWTRFGSLHATTARVASVPESGRIRVELEPHPESAPDLPLHHGQPATVEVAVEESTPAEVVLRIAGKRLQGPAPASSPP